MKWWMSLGSNTGLKWSADCTSSSTRLQMYVVFVSNWPHVRSGHFGEIRTFFAKTGPEPDLIWPKGPVPDPGPEIRTLLATLPMNFTKKIMVNNLIFPEGGIKTTYKMPPAMTQKVDHDCYPSKSQNQFSARKTTPWSGDEEEAGRTDPHHTYFYLLLLLTTTFLLEK